MWPASKQENLRILAAQKMKLRSQLMRGLISQAQYNSQIERVNHRQHEVETGFITLKKG